MVILSEESGQPEDGQVAAPAAAAPVIKIGQHVIWKGENYSGLVKWTSPSGVIVGVDFEQEIADDLAPGGIPYTNFFEFRKGHGRLLSATDLEPDHPTVETSSRKELRNNNNINGSTAALNGMRCGKGRGRCSANRSVSDISSHPKLELKVQQKETTHKKECTEVVPKILPTPSVNYEYLSGGRGIEWQSNSCYLDSTLFAFFYSHNIFDATIFSTFNSKSEVKSEVTTKIRQTLKNEIVYPLRRYLKCSGANVAKLRSILSQFNKKTISSFMDAEDFLFILLEQGLALREFIYYSNGVQDFMHQIIIDMNKAAAKRIDSVQSLLTTSMSLLDDNLKFIGIPTPALLIEMPRSDGRLIGYKAIVPNVTLNITELMSSGTFLRDCICRKPAVWACPKCSTSSDELGLINYRWTTFCDGSVARHNERHTGHKLVPIAEFKESNPVLLDLMSVICIRDSHYVAFTKCGKEQLSPWLFLNSFMKVQAVEDLGIWLHQLEEEISNQALDENLLKKCPEHVRRVLFDSHICIYSKR